MQNNGRSVVLEEPASTLEDDPDFGPVAKRVWERGTSKNYDTFERSLNTEIKRILKTEPDAPLSSLLKTNDKNELVWKSGYFKGQQLQYAHVIARQTTKNVGANPNLNVALENMSPVGDSFHLKTYGHMDEINTGYGKNLSAAAKNAIRVMSQEVPARPGAIPVAKGERGFVVAPIEIGGKLVRFGLRWLGPATEVLSYASALYDSYSTMSAVAQTEAKKYALLELQDSFPHSSFEEIEGYPLILDRTEHVLYEFETGLWRPEDVGSVVKAIDLGGYSQESQVYYDETMAAFKDQDGKWRLAVRQNVDNVAVYGAQEKKQ